MNSNVILKFRNVQVGFRPQVSGADSDPRDGRDRNLVRFLGPGTSHKNTPYPIWVGHRGGLSQICVGLRAGLDKHERPSLNLARFTGDFRRLMILDTLSSLTRFVAVLIA